MAEDKKPVSTKAPSMEADPMAPVGSEVNTEFGGPTIEQQLANLRDLVTGDILPDVNKMESRDKSMHYFWASTTNQSDPIYRRQQLGYVFVRDSEIKELSLDFRVKEGAYAGCVACNEMILMKIPLVLANEIMKINHYEKPLAEETRIKEEAVKKDIVDRSGKQIGSLAPEDHGFKNLVRDTKVTGFSL